MPDTFSLAIIALSWLNINVVVGSVLFGLSILLGGVRIAIGTHSPKDVYCAIIIALAVAYAGYIFLNMLNFLKILEISPNLQT